MYPLLIITLLTLLLIPLWLRLLKYLNLPLWYIVLDVLITFLALSAIGAGISVAVQKHFLGSTNNVVIKTSSALKPIQVNSNGAMLEVNERHWILYSVQYRFSKVDEPGGVPQELIDHADGKLFVRREATEEKPR